MTDKISEIRDRFERILEYLTCADIKTMGQSYEEDIWFLLDEYVQDLEYALHLIDVYDDKSRRLLEKLEWLKSQIEENGSN